MESGELLGVAGPVGCGKSSLLGTILRETVIVEGEVRTRGKIAYVEQAPCIFSATVKDNILFGIEEDPERLSEIIEVCELTQDLAELSHGLDTLIGEGGLNISGGQKARISLARACYADADIYLLDDPLSAVDSKVGARLFSNCLQGFLRSKAVVLVTHQLAYLSEVSKVLALESSGSPAFYGPPNVFS